MVHFSSPLPPSSPGLRDTLLLPRGILPKARPQTRPSGRHRGHCPLGALNPPPPAVSLLPQAPTETKPCGLETEGTAQTDRSRSRCSGPQTDHVVPGQTRCGAHRVEGCREGRGALAQTRTLGGGWASGPSVWTRPSILTPPCPGEMAQSWRPCKNGRTDTVTLPWCRAGLRPPRC